MIVWECWCHCWTIPEWELFATTMTAGFADWPTMTTMELLLGDGETRRVWAFRMGASGAWSGEVGRVGNGQHL